MRIFQCKRCRTMVPHPFYGPGMAPAYREVGEFAGHMGFMIMEADAAVFQCRIEVDIGHDIEIGMDLIRPHKAAYRFVMDAANECIFRHKRGTIFNYMATLQRSSFDELIAKG